MEVKVLKDILTVNDTIAAELRERFIENNCFVINMVSSPGAGKTTLIVETLNRLAGTMKTGVIVGDLATAHDAERINKTGMPVLQLNTGSACHLDGNMIKSALEHFDLAALDILIIENVGNLVCPAGFDLGEHKRVVLLSVPEGDEKVCKYPVIFRGSDVVLITKTDLLEYCPFSIDRVRADAAALSVQLQVLELSSRTGDGFDEWVAWLRQCRAVRQPAD